MPKSNDRRTLDDYRQAIYKAQNSHDLELLIYRALPTLYADMGMPYSANSPVSVATKLSRQNDNWRLWFNISIPKAIEALGHLAPDIFHRMSGGANQASSITTNAYGQGFLKETQPFALEGVFEQQRERLAARLNQATSLDSWWTAFNDELPWALARTRGWDTPNKKQWAEATTQATEFLQLHGTRLESFFLLDGRVHGDATVQVQPRLASAATSFSDRIDRKFYPLLNHLPGVELDSSAVHSFNIKTLSLMSMSKSLCERCEPIVFAHYAISNTRGMPTYLLVQAVKTEAVPAMALELPQSTEMESPTPF